MAKILNKRLIIGINSRIIKKIRPSLLGFDLISHQNIKTVNFQNYQLVFLFSWSHKSLNENIKLVKLIPQKKIIFISSIAVLSIQKNQQWNSYPINKKKIENIVLRNGGSVIRLGIFKNNSENLTKLVHPYTSYDELVSLLNNFKTQNNKIINCFSIINQKNEETFWVNFFYNLSNVNTEIILIRKLCEFTSKFFLRTKYYGYTADSLNFFAHNLMIGYGVLGNYYYKNNLPVDKILISNKNDVILNKNGFINTIIGFKDTGLSKYWHGAFCVKKNQQIYKKVPLFVTRSYPPKIAERAHVNKIIYKKNFFEIITSVNNEVKYFYAKNIILACGPIENSRLLNSLMKVPNKKILFDDQEWCFFGDISIDEAIEKKYIKKNFFLIFPNKIQLIKFGKFEILLEFRPFTIQDENSFQTFNRNTKGILYKLFSNFSLPRINEALFNKFGVSFITRKINLIGQIELKSSIIYEPKNNIIKRKRITKEDLITVQKKISKKFKSFTPYQNLITTDSQHIIGDKKILRRSLIKKFIFEKKIKILGSPTREKFFKFYPTDSYKSLIKKND